MATHQMAKQGAVMVSSDSLVDRFTSLEVFEIRLMAYLEGMASKQNLQHCRSLISCHTKNSVRVGIRDLMVADL